MNSLVAREISDMDRTRLGHVLAARLPFAVLFPSDSCNGTDTSRRETHVFCKIRFAASGGSGKKSSTEKCAKGSRSDYYIQHYGSSIRVRSLLHQSLFPRRPFQDTNPKDEPITSVLPT